MPSELDIFLSLPRHARRKVSRDQARALPIPPLPPRHGEVAMHVNAPHRMPVRPSPRSGQQRVNAKRNARAELWRTVKVRVSAASEQDFREQFHLLGLNARILGRHKVINAHAVDLDMNIPGAPAAAHRAELVVRGVFNGERYMPELADIIWFDADGDQMEFETHVFTGTAS